MNGTRKLTAVLVILSLWICTGPAFCDEPEPGGPRPAWGREGPGPGWGQAGMGEERIGRLMERVQQNDPETAERLAKLQEEDPNAFEAELRKIARQRWQEHRGAWEEPSGGPRGMEARGDLRGALERARQLRRQQREFRQWFAENYPTDANNLESIRQSNPLLYARKLMQAARKYGPVARASKDNPELAAVLKEDIELKERRNKILREIRQAEGEKKQTLTKELEQIVSKRFDLIIKRKQIELEQLQERLKKLESQIAHRQSEVEKWKDSKDEKVKEHTKDLLESKGEKFRWD